MSANLLVDLTPFILILGGIVAASWLLERIFKTAPIVGEPMSGLVKIMSLFGFFVGALLLITAVSTWSQQSWDPGTRYLLIVTGLALFLKPMKDVPWAALVGLVLGGLSVGFFLILHPLPPTILGISSTWAYLIIFIIPALFAYMFFKFAEDVLKLIGAILSFKPILILLGLVCIVQGILLALGTSIF